MHAGQGALAADPEGGRGGGLSRRDRGRGAAVRHHLGGALAHHLCPRSAGAQERGVSDPVFYLTTPIYYINARPHLGHAYTTIIADAMARYRRLRGDRVWFLTGTDEHGDKIAQAAARDGVSPQALADANSAAFRDRSVRLGITNDAYIRTTAPRRLLIGVHV